VSVFKGLARRLVAISSADVYRAYGRLLRLETGDADPVPLDEDAPLREALYPYRAQAQGPEDFKYLYEKILVERAVISDEDLPGTILRLPAVYGPNDRQHRLYGYLKRMDDGRPFIMLGEEQARWRWTRGYVENVSDAIALAVMDERAANRIYNVGEREANGEADWVRKLGEAAGWVGEIIRLPKEQRLPAHLQTNADYRHHLVTDSSRIRAELGYAERIPLRQALQRTIEWERANPPEQADQMELEYAAEDAALRQSA
jgi:nucleoside-diphosphate-sugar epimerase